MRHKYPTAAIVFARQPLAEESALLTLLTEDVGLVRARAQGVRKPGAKLASSLQTFAESDVILLAGKEGWRLSGALLNESWAVHLSYGARTRAGRVASLVLRLIHGETPDASPYGLFRAFLYALHTFPEADHDAIECLAALRLLALLGLDAGTIPGSDEVPFTAEAVADVEEHRTDYIARVNRGIHASGL